MVKDELVQLIQRKHANIAITGMGYVGAAGGDLRECRFCRDRDRPDDAKCEMINRGIIHPGCNQCQLRSIPRPTHPPTDYSVLNEIDAISICVPTLLAQTGDPDCPSLPRLPRASRLICTGGW